MLRRIDISKRYDYIGFFRLLETNKLTEEDFLVLSGLQEHVWDYVFFLLSRYILDVVWLIILD